MYVHVCVCACQRAYTFVCNWITGMFLVYTCWLTILKKFKRKYCLNCFSILIVLNSIIKQIISMMKLYSAGIDVLYCHRKLENFKMNNNKVFIVHIKLSSPRMQPTKKIKRQFWQYLYEYDDIYSIYRHKTTLYECRRKNCRSEVILSSLEDECWLIRWNISAKSQSDPHSSSPILSRSGL